MRFHWRRLSGLVLHALCMRDQPLVRRLLVFSAFLVVIPIGFIGFFSYQRSAEVLEDEARSYSWQIIEQVNTHVEYYVGDFETGILKILNDPAFGRFLRMRTPEEMDQSGIREKIKQVLQNAAYSRSDITNITVYLDRIATVDAIDEKFKSAHPIEPFDPGQLRETLPYNGEPAIITRTLKFEDRREQVISIVRRLFSPATLEPVGFIAMDVNFKRFQEIAEKVNIGHSGYMYIVDSQGHYVYHPNLSELGKTATLENMEEMLHGESGSFVTSGEDKRLLTYSHSSFLGWTLITSIPYEELIQNSLYIRGKIFIIVIITLGFAGLFGIGFASSIIQPIRKLQLMMKRVEAGDFSGQIEISSRDEIGLLAHGFNKMVARLNELVNEIYLSRIRETEMSLRQREIELKALQSQINPHFLFNSLETIRGMALERSMDDISDMTVSLAKLLRYNLNNQSPTVTLAEEILNTEIYLRVQKYRFDDKLEYKFVVPEWAKKQTIAKFSIQPIVENSIKYGIEPSAGISRISVTALRESDHAYIVRIQDTGIGISEEKLEEIRWNLMQQDVIAGGSGIGIVNVHRRIVHLFGDAYGIRIYSRGERGAVVDIHLPMNKIDPN